jgi:hypothetical protein
MHDGSEHNHADEVKNLNRIGEQISTTDRTTGLASGTVSSFTIGDRVTHHMFGDGTVDAVRDHKLRIKFETVGSKEILSSFITRPR